MYAMYAYLLTNTDARADPVRYSCAPHLHPPSHTQTPALTKSHFEDVWTYHAATEMVEVFEEAMQDVDPEYLDEQDIRHYLLVMADLRDLARRKVRKRPGLACVFFSCVWAAFEGTWPAGACANDFGGFLFVSGCGWFFSRGCLRTIASATGHFSRYQYN